MNKTREVPKLHLMKLTAICAMLGFASASASTRQGQDRPAPPRCQNPSIATSSVYFIPHVKDYCKTSTPCPKFRRQVRMQGSGTLPGNRVLTYTGKIRSLGSCNTAIGAAGTCLKPYISVAADPRYYSMGDIIEMPIMKGRVMTLPNGKTFIHPGYFIVEDVGGAIKGENRFDFFTGSLGMKNPSNTFGTKGSPDTQLQDMTDCNSFKTFAAVRRGSSANRAALAAIDNALDSSTSSRSVASRYSTGVR